MDNENSDYIPDNESSSDSTSEIISENASTNDDSVVENKNIKNIMYFVKQINVNCTEDDFVEILEDMFECIKEYIKQEIVHLSSPYFYKTLVRDIAVLFYDYWLDANLCYDDDFEDIEEFVENVFDLYVDFYEFTPRSMKYESLKQPAFLTNYEMEELKEKLEYLKQIPQPIQRTEEWYKFRHNLITASNIWKALSSQANQNSLIYEKCKPLNTNASASAIKTSIESPLHWGVKYEPLSVLIYEEMFRTKIGDFGCIPHSTHNFIGASPDGINIDETNRLLYGRMLEIKNICNRDITGIPKEEYWIQTQMQMETCDLDKCDFFETRFKEFVSANIFYQDVDHDYKGVVLHLIQKTNGYGIDISNTQIYNNQPKYVYMPLCIEKTEDAIQEWISTVRESMKNDFTLYSTIYWYLEEYSCILIQRNRAWVQAAVPKIEELWNII
jgi:putative phage-type endonuclease